MLNVKVADLGKSTMLFLTNHCPKDEVIALPFNLAFGSDGQNRESDCIRVVLHAPTGDRVSEDSS